MSEIPSAEERPSLFFWLVVVLAALYLLIRFLQGIAWVANRVG